MEVPHETVETALRFAQERGARTVFDPAPAHPGCIAWLDAVDFLTPNDNEATRLLGREGSIQDEQQAAEAATELRRRGAKSVVIKLGARGCFVATEQIYCAVKGFVVDAVDTTAAGDTFNGAFAVALGEGTPVVEAARFANAAAALSVTRRGAQSSIPSREQVDQFLEQAAAGNLR
jgi:ribokinase